MKSKLTPVLGASAIVLAAANAVYAQYTPPAPLQPFPGFINDYLRKQDPYYSVWDIGGAVRARYEGKEGGLGLPPANDFRATTSTGTRNNNDYFSTKVLARVSYTDKWWSAYVEGRSSETWSDSRSPTGVGAVPGPGGRNGPEQDGIVDLHQAYVTLGNHKEFPVSVKIGRQELSYGDERLVGAFAWNNIGRVFDAAKIRCQTEWFAAEAFGSKLVLPNDNNHNVWNDYSSFCGLHITTKKLPKNTTELYFFARNEDIGSATANGTPSPTVGAVLPFQLAAPAARDIYTVGGRLKSNPGDFGAFDYTVEGAYQFGSWKQTTASAKLDQEAYAFMANLGYTFGDSAMTPRLALEYCYGSGDDSPTDGKHGTFDNLFPTNHKFYGYMDFLSWQNVHDVRLAYTMKPHPRMSLALEAHSYWLADTGDNFYNAGGVARGGAVTTPGNGYGINPSYHSHLGYEADIVAGFILTKFAMLEAGYGHYFAGQYVDQTWQNAGGSKDADWFYLQTVVRF